MGKNASSSQNYKKSSYLTVIIYKVLDAYIFMCVEYIKTFIRECILLLSQIVNFVIRLLLHLVYKPGQFEQNVFTSGELAVKEKGIPSVASMPFLEKLKEKKKKKKIVGTRLKNPPKLQAREDHVALSPEQSDEHAGDDEGDDDEHYHPHRLRDQPTLVPTIDETNMTLSQKQQAEDMNTNDKKQRLSLSKSLSALASLDKLARAKKSLLSLASGSSDEGTGRRKKSSLSSGEEPLKSHKKPKENRLNELLEKTIMLNSTIDDQKQIVANIATPLPSDEIENRQKRELEDDFDVDEASLIDEDLSTADSVDDDELSSVPNQRTILATIYNSVLSVILWFVMLIWYIPSLFQAPVSKSQFSVRNDKVHVHEKKSTGLIQDITLTLLDFTDSIAQAIRLFIRFQWIKCWKQIKFSFALFKLSKLLSTEGIDDRTVAQVIIDEGFPHESITCETQDGYVLHMDRIPNRKARKVVYFQHGILDSGFAWVGSGVSRSIALRAYSLKDVDIFLGNFRGFGLSPHYLETTEAFNKKNFWDYSFNEHAFYDVRAFVEKITEIKKRELGCDEDGFTINVVAHSMGAGCILAYLVHSRLTNQAHHLKNVMLLAPAGIHQKIPFIANVMSYTCMPLVRRLIPYFGITTREKKVLFAKILQDINNHPALRALWTVAVSKLLLGGPVEESPFQYIHNILYQSYNGTSVKVVDHLIQMKRCGKFVAYDYGSAEENQKHYGQDTPWNFLAHYKDIDPIIPIHIMYGDDDRIIPPHNILTHAHELKRCHGDYIHVKKFVGCGHLELTLGMNAKVINYILHNIKG